MAAPIAQLVERYTCNVKVSCSIHGGSLANEGELAQMVERTLSMREVLGSMPSFSILILYVLSCNIKLYVIISCYRL